MHLIPRGKTILRRIGPFLPRGWVPCLVLLLYLGANTALTPALAIILAASAQAVEEDRCCCLDVCFCTRSCCSHPAGAARDEKRADTDWVLSPCRVPSPAKKIKGKGSLGPHFPPKQAVGFWPESPLDPTWFAWCYEGPALELPAKIPIPS